MQQQAIFLDFSLEKMFMQSRLSIVQPFHTVGYPSFNPLPYEARKVDVRLPGKGNSNSYGARPVHQIISMIKWIRTSRLSMKDSVSTNGSRAHEKVSHQAISWYENRCETKCTVHDFVY